MGTNRYRLAAMAGQGLPHLFAPSSPITRVGDYVLPQTKLLFRSALKSPVSLRLCLRPSQNARRFPRFVAIGEGIRYVW
jgi:hypothetical protein